MRFFRNLKQIDVKTFKVEQKDIISTSLYRASWYCVEDLAKCYAPLKSKVIVVRPKVPWFNDSLKDAPWKLGRKMLHPIFSVIKMLFAMLLTNSLLFLMLRGQRNIPSSSRIVLETLESS